MDIYLIRHTSVATPTGICYGRSDVALSETYAAEKVVVASKLAEPLAAGTVLTYASPLRRCRQLAEDLASGPVHFDERLREYDFGRWELQLWADLPPTELDPWMADFVTMPAPDGETFGGLQARTVEFLEELVTAAPAGPVLVFAHSAVIRSLLCHCLGLPLTNAFRLGLGYGAVSKIQFRHGQFSVEYINR